VSAAPAETASPAQEVEPAWRLWTVAPKVTRVINGAHFDFDPKTVDWAAMDQKVFDDSLKQASDRQNLMSKSSRGNAVEGLLPVARSLAEALPRLSGNKLAKAVQWLERFVYVPHRGDALRRDDLVILQAPVLKALLARPASEG
jgi:hypothetical protein